MIISWMKDTILHKPNVYYMDNLMMILHIQVIIFIITAIYFRTQGEKSTIIECFKVVFRSVYVLGGLSMI